MRTATTSILVIALTLSVVASTADMQRLAQPVAMSISGSGDLLMLDEIVGIVRIPPGPDLRNYRVLVAFPLSWQAVDMTSAGTGANERIFVTLAQGHLGMLMQYSSEGQWEGSWPQTTILTGIAADEKNQRIFLAGTLTGNIYSYSWNDRSANPVKAFSRMYGAQSLGPLALDTDRLALFAGDLRTGKILSMDLNSKKVRVVTESLGEPAALAFDPAGRKLYVADGAGRKIWVVRVDGKRGKAIVFAAVSAFRQPSAIAIGADGAVWVGDTDAKTIFRLSPNGTVLTTYQLVLTTPPGQRTR